MSRLVLAKQSFLPIGSSHTIDVLETFWLLNMGGTIERKKYINSSDFSRERVTISSKQESYHF